jgi:hypothetical protein
MEASVIALVASGKLERAERPKTAECGGWQELDAFALDFKQSRVFVNAAQGIVVKEILRPRAGAFYSEVHRYHAAHKRGLAPQILGFYWADGGGGESRGQIISKYYGRSLKEVVLCPDSKRTDTALKRGLADELAEAIAAHPDLYNRDLKPANILIKNGWQYDPVARVLHNCRAVVCDWGCSK